jgi:hypothetical protein
VGAVGLLYEQASTQGARIARLDGAVLTFRESVRRQVVSFMANLHTAAAHREELLRSFRAERERELVREETAFVVLPHGQPNRARALVRALLAQGIEVYRSGAERSVDDLRCYWTGEKGRGKVPAGALIVPARQPYRRLVRTLLAFDPPMDAEFLRTERRRLEREQRSRLYDVTGWSVSTSSGLPIYAVDRVSWTSLERLEQADDVAPGSGTVLRPETPYGFLIDGGDDRCLQALARLWDEGCTVHAAREPFTLEGRAYPRGTLLLRRDLNRAPRPRTANACAVGFGVLRGDGAQAAPGSADPLAAALERVATATGVAITGVGTALAQEGPDLGSPRFRMLWPPRIAVAAGPTIAWTSYGTTAWVLDHELRVAMTPLAVSALREADLARYDVLVLPDAWQGPGAYREAMGSEGLRRLRSWVYDGGTLIASGSGAAFVADTSSGLGTVHLRRQRLSGIAGPAPAQDEAPPPRGDLLPEAFRAATLRWAKPPGVMDGLFEDGLLALRRPEPFWAWAAGRPRAEIEEEDARMRLFHARGALLRVGLDAEHWLSAGCAVLTGLPECPLAGAAPGEWLVARVYAEHALVADDPSRVVGAFASEDSLRMSGLLWPEARERLARTAYLTREPVGRGQVILFCSDPSQRGTLAATERALLNAVLLGPGLGTTRRWPW